MTLRSLAGTTALVLSMTSTGLLADVTPEDVWQAWQNASTAMGTTVTAESAVRDGAALVVSGIVLGDSTGGTVTLNTISFTDNGDGSVAVVFPDNFPVKVSIPATAGDPTSTATDVVVDVTLSGAVITAFGTPDAISYQADAPQVDMRVDVSENGSIGTIAASLTGVQMDHTVTNAQAQSYEEVVSIASTEVTLKGSEAANSTDFALTAKIADLHNTLAVSVPADASADTFEAALAKGLTMNSQFGMGATTFDLTSTQAGAVTKIGGSLKDGAVTVALDAGKVDYYNNFNTLSLNISSPDVPVPNAAMGLGQAEVHLMFPMMKSDTPADFAFLFNLTDLSFADDIWALIDPGKAFKHDPATVVVDTHGQVTLAQDLTADAAAVSAADPNAVGELNALDVPNILLKAGGAELTAQGGFTFDNTDLTTFAGVPAPTGKIDIKATGVNALLDTLVAMGLVPEDQANQGRMMLSMFANTSPTADEMTSTLEFKDKHFFANGQQLQ